MSSSDETPDDSDEETLDERSGAPTDDRTRDMDREDHVSEGTNRSTSPRQGTVGRASGTGSRASGWGAGLVILVIGLWIIIAAFFWGDPVDADDVVARGISGPAVSEATGDVVAIEASSISGASTLYWSNIAVGIIVIIIAIALLAIAAGFMSE